MNDHSVNGFLRLFIWEGRKDSQDKYVNINLLHLTSKVEGYLLIKKDHSLLDKWLSDPLVLEFYEGRNNPFHADKVYQKFYNCHDDVVRYIVLYESIAIGYIQYYMALVKLFTGSINVSVKQIIGTKGLGQYLSKL